jgi:hypothetical protein
VTAPLEWDFVAHFSRARFFFGKVPPIDVSENNGDGNWQLVSPPHDDLVDDPDNLGLIAEFEKRIPSEPTLNDPTIL